MPFAVAKRKTGTQLVTFRKTLTCQHNKTALPTAKLNAQTA
ncbi:hypothetical protein PhaeoP72_00183 [Phaeobacter inhibens]|nr:hypothetical protein PhaeoP72_00183 [Phaeobacter inhibens]